MGLEDEDVVGVAVHREALRPGRGQVGVGLAGVPERELQLGDQPGERRPVAVQALQHDGGAALEQVDDLARIDQAGQGLAGQGGAGAGVARLRQHRAVAGEAHGGRADRGRGEQVVDVVEGEQPDEVGRIGLVQVHV